LVALHFGLWLHPLIPIALLPASLVCLARVVWPSVFGTHVAVRWYIRLSVSAAAILAVIEFWGLRHL
jgi:hypothetical protein